MRAGSKILYQQKKVMQCWKCGTDLSLPLGKISFRAECDRCGAALHCCVNCRYYQIGKPNDCQIPGTEWVRDRIAANLCEEFACLGKKKQEGSSDKKKFDDLFR